MINLSPAEQDLLQIVKEHNIVPIPLQQADTIYRAGPHTVAKDLIDSLRNKGLLMAKGTGYAITQAGRNILDLE